MWILAQLSRTRQKNMIVFLFCDIDIGTMAFHPPAVEDLQSNVEIVGVMRPALCCRTKWAASCRSHLRFTCLKARWTRWHEHRKDVLFSLMHLVKTGLWYIDTCFNVSINVYRYIYIYTLYIYIFMYIYIYINCNCLCSTHDVCSRLWS